MNNYTLDISKEEWIQVYTNEWVLNWCKQNHPKIFDEAIKQLSEIYDQNNNNIDD